MRSEKALWLLGAVKQRFIQASAPQVNAHYEVFNWLIGAAITFMPSVIPRPINRFQEDKDRMIATEFHCKKKENCILS